MMTSPRRFSLAHYTHPSTLASIKYAKALVINSLICEEVYDYYVLRGTFIEVVHETARQSMRYYYSTHLG